MKFLPKCRVLCLELKKDIWQLQKGERRRQEGRSAPPYRASWSTEAGDCVPGIPTPTFELDLKHRDRLQAGEYQGHLLLHVYRFIGVGMWIGGVR